MYILVFLAPFLLNFLTDVTHRQLAIRFSSTAVLERL
jgi:hypothetical protein